MITKSEHTIWAAYFSSSIFMQWCVSLPTFVISQRLQVYSCACCTPADQCVICVILHTFSQMCPCLLLVGAHVTLGALPVSIHNIDMQCLTHPFTDLSGSVPTYYAHAPFFLWDPLSFFMFFHIDIRLLPPWYAHIADAAISACWYLAPFVLVHRVCFYWSIWRSGISLRRSTLNLLPHHSLGH